MWEGLKMISQREAIHEYVLILKDFVNLLQWNTKLMSLSGFAHDADHWITTGGGENEYGEHSGRHIKIDDDGNIVGGAVPKSAQGKNIKSWWKKDKPVSSLSSNMEQEKYNSPLKGTPKQITWAEKIRKDELDHINRGIKDARLEIERAKDINNKKGESEPRNLSIQHLQEKIAFYEYNRKMLSQEESASNWINNNRGIGLRLVNGNNGLRNGRIVDFSTGTEKNEVSETRQQYNFENQIRKMPVKDIISRYGLKLVNNNGSSQIAMGKNQDEFQKYIDVIKERLKDISSYLYDSLDDED
jgi:hypothetical protein